MKMVFALAILLAPAAAISAKPKNPPMPPDIKCGANGCWEYIRPW
jgi:hypothetical protein